MLKKKKRNEFKDLKNVNKLEYCRKVFVPGVIFNNSEAIGYKRDDVKIQGDSYRVYIKEDSGNIMITVGNKNSPMNWTLYNSKNNKFAKIVE